MKAITIKFSLLFVLALLFVSSGSQVSALVVTETGVPDPLSTEIEATLDWTVSTSDVDTDDYTMSTDASGSKIHMPIPDAQIYAGDGESALDVGTSYIKIGRASCRERV